MRYGVYAMEGGNSWIIAKLEVSNGILETYKIDKNELECHCNIKCEDCKTCIHQYSCNCILYGIRFVMCKHIHFLCTNVLPASNPSTIEMTEVDEEPSLQIDDNLQEQHRVITQTLKTNASVSSEKTMAERKTALISKSINLIMNCETPEQLQMLEKSQSINELKLEIMISPNNLPAVPQSIIRQPVNKLIQHQRKQFSLKKKKTEKNESKF